MALGQPAAEDRASSARATDVPGAFDKMRALTKRRAALRSLEPRHREYRGLRTALADLRADVLRGGWPPVDSQLWLEPGDTADAETLQILAERLRSSGDLGDEWPSAADDDLYDGVIVEAVRRFQRRHGLVRDGIVGDRIRYLVFNPYWNVPDSIVRNAIAATGAEDPARREEERFEVLSGWDDDAEAINPWAVDWEADRIGYRVRLRPGPDHAFGRVKFMFPNRYSVYLHDTPARSRFEDLRRALSHGCVRVGDPNALAEVLLSTTEAWPVERIVQAMTARERKAVRLDTPVPVHLLYFTAWVDGEGVIHFRDDVYGRDRGARAWLGWAAAVNAVSAGRS